MLRRVLIADDNPVILRTIRFWIESKTDWEVCGEASDGRTAVALAERLKPDTVILDVSMPVMTGLEAANTIRASNPSTRIILMTMFQADFLRDYARRMGIRSVLAKDGFKTLNDLVSALRDLSGGSG